MHGLHPRRPRDEGRLTRGSRVRIPRNRAAGRYAIWPAAVLLLAGVAGCKRDSPPEPDVWAVVNGQEIHRGEAEKYYAMNSQNAPQSQDEAISLTLNVLDELINDDILVQRAQKLGLQATDGEVEDKFTEFKSPYTEDEFQRQLKDRGVGVDDLKQQIRTQLSAQKLINREVVSKISITDQDVTNFYNQNKAQFNVAEKNYRIAQILVTPRRDPQLRNRKNDDATTEPEAQKKCAALLAQLNKGADFSELAMDYSEDPATASSGGDLGYVTETNLNQSDPILKQAVVALKPGEISGVVTTHEADGVHYRILKLISEEVPGQRELSDPQVQQSIRDTLRNRKEQVLRAAYIADARDQAKVVNYLAEQVMESNGKLPDSTDMIKAPAAAPSAPYTPQP